jgi:hypothetical protein
VSKFQNACKVIFELPRPLLRSSAVFVGVLALSGLASVSCYEQAVGRDTEEVRQRVADASVTFQANHDSDRREEIGLLCPRTTIGSTKAEVQAFLGDPMPGISDDDKWFYDLGGKDSLTLHFSDDDRLKTKYWLSMPVEVATTPVHGARQPARSEGDTAPSPEQAPDAETGAGPTASTGTSRS